MLVPRWRLIKHMRQHGAQRDILGKLLDKVRLAILRVNQHNGPDEHIVTVQMDLDI